jgi:hypothetical protein
MTRKIAEPMIAAARCTTAAYSTPPRIVRIGRALASRDVLREVLVASNWLSDAFMAVGSREQ